MRVWFMFDNHAIALVEGDRAAALRRLFAEDGCGSAFARDVRDRSHAAPLHGHRLPSGQYGVRDDEIDAFLARIDELENWEARG